MPAPRIVHVELTAACQRPVNPGGIFSFQPDFRRPVERGTTSRYIHFVARNSYSGLLQAYRAYFSQGDNW